MPLPMTIGTGRAALLGGADLRSVLLANATYAWYGDDLPASGNVTTWTDMIAGVALAATGTPTVGSLNGRRGVAFPGSAYLKAALPTTTNQPNEIVIVAQASVATADGWYLFDANGATNRQAVLVFGVTLIYDIFAGTEIFSTVTGATAPIVARARFNGANSKLWINGVEVIAGNAGANALGGVTLGTRFSGTQPITGVMALAAITSGANYAAAGDAIEAAARIKYGV